MDGLILKKTTDDALWSDWEYKLDERLIVLQKKRRYPIGRRRAKIEKMDGKQFCYERQ